MSLDHWHIPTSEEEIVDVFVEEVGELLAGVDEQMQAWARNPGDKMALTEIRRTFHTIKGRGRMVKALDLSELAWKVESLLNRAISGIVQPSGQMVSLVASVRAQIPKMVSAFEQGRSVTGNREIARLVKAAEDLAAGKNALQPMATITAIDTPETRQIRLSELDLKYDRCMQRADEALHRSEMALQRARQNTASCQATRDEVGSKDSCAELDRVGERVNQLAKEVEGGLLASKIKQRDSFLNQSELSPIIERRLRSKMAPLELLRMELEREIEANRGATRRLRRYGWAVVVLSALLGGAAATGLYMTVLSGV